MAGETWRDDRSVSDSSTQRRPDGPTKDSSAQSGRPARTIRDEAATTVLRLPSVLAGDWRIERELASRGAEADLILVSDAAGTRRVVKTYRAGIEPNTDVLERVGVGRVPKGC